MSSVDNLTLGEKIRRYREARGWNQKELADNAGVSAATVSKAERGEYTPSPDKLRKIADALGIKLEELINVNAETEVSVLIKLMKIYAERLEYENALKIIAILQRRTDLLDHQKIDLILTHADCLMRSGECSPAIKLLEKLREDLEQSTSERISALICNKLGTAYFLSHKVQKAYAYYLRAYQITASFPTVDELAATIAFNMGKVNSRMKNAVEARDYFQVAESYYRGIADQVQLADTLFANGIVYKDLNQLFEAENCLQEALMLYKAHKQIRLAQRVKYNIAFLITSQTEPVLAIQELTDCAKSFEDLHDIDRSIQTHAAIAKIYLDLNDCAKAKSHLDIAFSKMPNGEKTQPKFAFIYQVQALYFLAMDIYEQAIESSFISSELFGKMGIDRETADALEIAIEAFEKSGRKDEALALGKKARDLLRCSLDNPFVL